MGVLKNVPKSYVYRIIRSGEVRINGGRKKPYTRLEIADKVRIPPYKEATREAPVIADHWHRSLLEQVIFEDDVLLVVNKPAGLVVHGGSAKSFGLVDILRDTVGAHAELVHRLDKDTSGCLLVAKTPRVCRMLQQQFRDGEVKKTISLLSQRAFFSPRFDLRSALENSETESRSR